ncbi:hypothetical protein E2C01_025324 [Portunus trituberculatus]|uniref:Uncharacterized protein n=1 Tax=Portunus trituberculatus TaxID=210409 RepID=A0A5B7ED23_PORTR|nr:hypothetical protein [Portunus trituberculatus]
MVPTARVDPLTSDIGTYTDPIAYLSYEFEKMCSNLKLPEEKERNLRERCVSCVVRLTNELRNRLPENFKIWKMSLFAVEECLRVIKKPIVEVAELLGYLPE